ncbi:MAG: response regulator transcription factor [Spirochaetales bacterium]|nr:response regulator transcription factor [Spirochaetales bacterium]
MKLIKKETPRVIVVDDHPVFRIGIIKLIRKEIGIKHIDEAGNTHEALSKLDAGTYNYAIIDISLNGVSGLELTKIVKERYPQLSVLVVSMYDEEIYAKRALDAGANGYIMKRSMPSEMLEALRQFFDGKIYVSKQIGEKLLMGMLKRENIEKKDPIDTLSNREFEVFQLIGEGLKPVQIADELNLSVQTIETYKHHIKGKLHINNSFELRKYAINWITSNRL